MAPVRTAVWERADAGRGHSFARMAPVAGGWEFHGSEVLSGAGTHLACWFRVLVGPDWLTREAHVSAVAASGERTLSLAVDNLRRWRVDGRHQPELDGCADVDIAATPLTNTFPLRRLYGLAVGESSMSPVAWVEVPTLAVSRVEQTYRRLADAGGLRAWEYSDARHGAFRLTVDADGLVVDYEGFARRV